MNFSRVAVSTRSLFYCFALLASTGLILIAVGSNVESGSTSAQEVSAEDVTAPSAVFAGTGVGVIPDTGLFSGCNVGGAAPLNISFAVTGMSAPLTDVRVNLTGNHTWIGDLKVTLLSPGGTANAVVFSRTGALQATTCGNSGNLGGPYNFYDTAPASPTWWSTAAATADANTIPSGDYRPSTAGGTATSGANTTITNAFTGLTTGQINGTWTLQVEDVTGEDTGSITSANLTLTSGVATPTPPDALGDYDGDGKTDFAVIRNTGGGLNGQATWFIQTNSTAILSSQNWGLASDTFIPGDFDGDGKDDIAVWRPGTPQAAFFVIRSQTNTIQVQEFGTSSDDPSVVGDYNNDGIDDFAVYRPGASPGAQSFFYVVYGGIIYSQAWGLFGDIPAPGDYDGDGKMDFAVQRSQGGNGVFYIRYTEPKADTVTTFGLGSDMVVPGDYDGDLKTDLAVVSTNGGGFYNWIYRPSSGGSDVTDEWGIASTDYVVPGDYNGDGKADYAVWRPGATSNALSTFHIMRPIVRVIETRQWGLGDDVPVNLTFAHF